MKNKIWEILFPMHIYAINNIDDCDKDDIDLAIVPAGIIRDTYKDTNGDGIGDVPETYGIMQGRKVVEDNKNIWNIIKNPNRYTMIIGAAVLLLAGIVFALGKLIAKKILKNKKS